MSEPGGINEVAGALSGTEPGEQYPYERRIIFFTSLGHAMMHVLELIYAGILPLLLIQFDLSLAEVGILVFPSLVFLGLGSFPAGLLSDRWNSYKIFLIFFFGSGAGAVLAAMSRTVWQLAAALGVMGLFLSFYHPAGLGLISMGVRRKGLVMGIHGIFGSLGLAVAPFLAGFLGQSYGWQSAFLAPAVLVFISGIGLLFFPIRIAHHEVDAQGNKVKGKIEPAARHTLLWLYSIMIVLGFVYRGLMTYMPKYFGESVQVSWLSVVVAGGLFASITLTMGGLGQVWGGHLSDRIEPFKLYSRIVPLFAPLLLFAVFFTGYPLVIGMCVFFFFFFASQPLENQMLAQATPPNYRSTGYGVKFGLNMGIGALAAPFCGWIGDRFGMAWIFYTLALILLASVPGVFRLKAVRDRPKS